MNPLIVGLGYKQRCGKGTVAKMCSDLGAKHLSFGFALKNECMAWLTEHRVDFIRQYFYGDSTDRMAMLTMDTNRLLGTELAGLVDDPDCFNHNGDTHFTARRFLQYYGTEYRRAQDVNYWAYQTEADMMDVITKGRKFVVFDDVRFENEAEIVKDNGGIMIRIDRDDRPGAVSEGHASDTSMANYTGWDYSIGNNGTVQDLTVNFNRLILPHLMEHGLLQETANGD